MDNEEWSKHGPDPRAAASGARPAAARCVWRPHGPDPLPGYQPADCGEAWHSITEEAPAVRGERDSGRKGVGRQSAAGRTACSTAASTPLQRHVVPLNRNGSGRERMTSSQAGPCIQTILYLQPIDRHQYVHFCKPSIKGGPRSRSLSLSLSLFVCLSICLSLSMHTYSQSSQSASLGPFCSIGC